MENVRILSFHNLSVMEQLLDDFQKETLKLRLAYEHLARHEFTSALDSLFYECVSFLEHRVDSFSVLFDCVSKGHDMNVETNSFEGSSGASSS